MQNLLLSKEKPDFLFIQLIAVYFIISFLFLPSFYYTPDEHTYIYQSQLFLHGKLCEPGLEYSNGLVYNGSCYISKYAPLMSFILVPFVALGGISGTLILNVLLHFFGFIFFYKILSMLRVDKRISMIFLFMPFLNYYSHTVLSETSTVFFTMAAIYFYMNKKFFRSGIFFGLNILMRHTNFLIVLPVLIFTFFQGKKNFIKLLCPVGAFLVLLAGINHVFYGNFLTSGYSLSGELASFSLQELPYRLIIYLVLLNLVFPLLLFAQFFTKNNPIKKELLAISGLFLAFYSVWWFFRVLFRVEDLFFGIRFFAPVIAILLIPYALFLHETIKKFRVSKIIVTIIIIVLLLSNICVFYFMNERISNREMIYDKIHSQIPDKSIVFIDTDLGTNPESKFSPFARMFFTKSEGDIKLANIEDLNYYTSLTGYHRYTLKLWFEGTDLNVLIKKIN